MLSEVATQKKKREKKREEEREEEQRRKLSVKSVVIRLVKI